MAQRHVSKASGTVTDADRERFVSKGAAHFALDQPAATRDFYFLMLPKMTMLAFSAAVEPLRIANQLTGKCLYRWYLLSEDGQPVRCSNAVSTRPARSPRPTCRSPASSPARRPRARRRPESGQR